MMDRLAPVVREVEEVLLTGTMAIYSSQTEASLGIPQQWRVFRLANPALVDGSRLYGASPCTSDHKIHYLTGIATYDKSDSILDASVVLEAGEYAVVRAEDPALLRETWGWLLGQWLPSSGRRERNAPEFERYSDISDGGIPIGPVEIWIPLEPLVRD